jgi:hypothetical protein
LKLLDTKSAYKKPIVFLYTNNELSKRIIKKIQAIKFRNKLNQGSEILSRDEGNCR